MMKFDWFKITIMGCLSFILIACNQVTNPNTPGSATSLPTDTIQVIETQTAHVSPTQGDSQMTPSLPAPAGPDLQNLIERTKEDLANRLAILVDEIDLVEVTEVEWSDSSLDCPQPGMEYLQVLTPGYRILLDVNGQMYEYHSNRDSYFVYCENPDSPVIPKP